MAMTAVHTCFGCGHHWQDNQMTSDCPECERSQHDVLMEISLKYREWNADLTRRFKAAYEKSFAGLFNA